MNATNKAYKSARELRRNMSLPEVLLWQRLRGKKPKFRRQHPIGPYVADFYCAAVKIVIEVDGITHDMGDRPGRDERRTKFLEDRGLRVIRIPAAELMANADEVADALIRLCARPLHRADARSPSPSCDGEDQE